MSPPDCSADRSKMRTGSHPFQDVKSVLHKQKILLKGDWHMKKKFRIRTCIALAVLSLTAASLSAGAVYAETEGKAVTASETAAKEEGWKTVKGKTYYYADGKKATGVKTIDGKTYIFKSTGVLVKNKKVYKAGKKYYKIDKKGVAVRFKGVEALAAKRLLTKKINLNLKKAFKWAAMDFYTVAPPSSKKEAKIARYYGEFGFKHGRGDCYVQAYTFYWMAKVLGYNVKVVRGYVEKSSGLATHAWVEMKTKKGKVYVYDPNFYKEYSAKLGDKNAGYKFTYSTKKKTLKYYSAKKKLLSVKG